MPVPIVDDIHLNKKKEKAKRNYSKIGDKANVISNPPSKNIFPMGAPVIKIPTTLDLVSPSNNLFVANNIVINPQKKNKKKKAITKTAFKNTLNTFNEVVEKDGTVIKPRRIALNENDEIEKQDQMEKICDLC